MSFRGIRPSTHRVKTLRSDALGLIVRYAHDGGTYYPLDEHVVLDGAVNADWTELLTKTDFFRRRRLRGSGWASRAVSWIAPLLRSVIRSHGESGSASLSKLSSVRISSRSPAVKTAGSRGLRSLS